MTVYTVTITLDGATYDLSETSDGTWSATLTAPTATSGSNNSGDGPGVGSNASGLGYYPCVITVTDDAANVTTVDTSDPDWGDVLKLIVFERTAPVAGITSLVDGEYITSSTPEISLRFTDSGSGIDPDRCYVSIDGIEHQLDVSVDGDTATGAFTPSALSEGVHVIEAWCYDYDGNASDVASASITVDTVPPALKVWSPIEGHITNDPSVTVSGVTCDVTSSPSTVAIVVGTETYTPTVGTDGGYSQSVALSEGVNTVTVTATDRAGHVTTVTRSVMLDTIAPVITGITLVRTATDMDVSYTIAVTAEDEKTEVVDVWGCIHSVESLSTSHDGDEWLFEVPEGTAGSFQVEFRAQDEAGNVGCLSTTLAIEAGTLKCCRTLPHECPRMVVRHADRLRGGELRAPLRHARPER